MKDIVTFIVDTKTLAEGAKTPMVPHAAANMRALLVNAVKELLVREHELTQEQFTELDRLLLEASASVNAVVGEHLPKRTTGDSEPMKRRVRKPKPLIEISSYNQARNILYETIAFLGTYDLDRNVILDKVRDAITILCSINEKMLGEMCTQPNVFANKVFPVTQRESAFLHRIWQKSRELRESDDADAWLSFAHELGYKDLKDLAV